MPGLALADYRHNDLTAKNCPSPFVNLNIRETDPRWVAFRDKVRGALA
jgi:hypothetical protein